MYIASYIATYNFGEITVEVITHYTHCKISVEHILCMYIHTSVSQYHKAFYSRNSYREAGTMPSFELFTMHLTFVTETLCLTSDVQPLVSLPLQNKWLIQHHFCPLSQAIKMCFITMFMMLIYVLTASKEIVCLQQLFNWFISCQQLLITSGADTLMHTDLVDKTNLKKPAAVACTPAAGPCHVQKI